MTVEINQVGTDVWEQRVNTAAHPLDVFDYIANFPRHVEWERELLTVQALGRRGDYLKTYGAQPKGFADRIFNRGLRVTCKLTEFDRPRRIAWRQYRSHDASGASSFQQIEFAIFQGRPGSLVVVTRRFQGNEGISADIVARFSSRLGQAFQGMPAEFRAAASGGSGGLPGPFSTPGEAARHILEGHPSRGPGPTSIERLKVILDGGSRG